MTLTHCHACGAVLPEHEDGTLVFCARCGTAQVRISEELREAAEEYDREHAAGGTSVAGRPAGQIDWRAALSLAAVGALAVAVLCAFVPPMIAAAWLLPSAVLAVYRARSPQAQLSAGVGARMGAMCGMLCAAAFAAVATVQAVLLRFVAHRMDGFDTAYAASLAQLKDRALTQYGPDVAQRFGILVLPEYRVGMMLGVGAVCLAVLLVMSILCGALAGWVRGQARQRRG